MTAPQAPPKLHIPSAEQVATSGLARWGIYGLNGTGKTTFLSTIPADIPAWVISADDENVKPLKGLTHVKTPKITHWDQLGDYYELVRKAYASEPRAWEKFPGVPRLVAFDTWTRIQALAANKIAGYTPAEAELAIKYISRAPGLPKGYEAWQQIAALSGEWMRYFERLPIHLIFLFQEQEKEPKEGSVIQEPKIGPMLTPAAIQHAKDTLDIVGRLYVTTEKKGGNGQGEIKLDVQALASGRPPSLRDIDEDVVETRKLLLGQHPLYVTKGDTKKLGYVVSDPTWAKLAESLK